MATEEVSKPSSLPPYPQMIFEALDALKEKEGSNKSSIWKYMESTYGDLPAGHSGLLSHHLNRMKETGQLVFSKNNYMRLDPNAPPKRGRGRPPKPKAEGEQLSVEAAPGPSRPRGRPRKDPNTPPARKKEKVAPPPTPSAAGEDSEELKSGRPRGRPPKVKPQQAQVGVQAN